MRRGDAAVITISAALAAVVVAGVAFSLVVLDRKSGGPTPEPSDSKSSLLVLTWGPSLCKADAANPGCRSGHVDRMGQSFVLHGLWPQPSTEQYCGVPRQQSDRARKPVALPGDLQATLQTMMSDSATLSKHEWYAHGTCAGVPAPEYFGIAARLTDEANRALKPLFSRAKGQRLSSRSVREAVDGAFGAGAGERASLSCKEVSGKDSIVYEVRLSLPSVPALGTAGNAPSLADALAEGPRVPPGCGQGRVP